MNLGDITGLLAFAASAAAAIVALRANHHAKASAEAARRSADAAERQAAAAEQALPPPPPPVAWQVSQVSRHGSYFAGSVGGAPLAKVREYIESQQRPA